MGRLATDVGGTFTDLVYFDEASAELVVTKTLTTPADPSEGVLTAIARSGIAPEAVRFFVHGGTTVINAITERKGARTALVTTAGFRDVLEIGRGNRPDMYNLRYRSPEPFVPRRFRFEVRERLDARGRVVEPLRLAELDPIVEACRAGAIEAIAVVFLHGYVNPAHEDAAVDYLRGKLPDVAVTASNEISREWREYERSNTAVLNAYVQPIIGRYFDRLGRSLDQLGVPRPYFAMQSNGGTTDFSWAKARPLTLVESGPAGGVNGAALVGRLIGADNVIYLDIGGTTAKCSIIQGGEATVHTDYRMGRSRASPGYPVQIPTVDIVEIGAGGGSIAWFDQTGALKVGPTSAGADPGPACYDRGGSEPTVTDAKLITGVLDPNNFAGASMTLDMAAARRAMAQIADRLGASIEDGAVAVIRVVDANMINALKLISVQRGHDPSEFVFVASGGGGPMHAAELGRELGVEEIVIPPHSGLFSAWGMLATVPRHDSARTATQPFSAMTIAGIRSEFAGMEAAARRYFTGTDSGADDIAVRFQHALDMRYQGQEHTVTFAIDLRAATTGSILDDFHRAHERAYTFSLAETEADFVSYRLKSELATPVPRISELAVEGNAGAPSAKGRRAVIYPEDGTHEARIYHRDGLAPSSAIDGPCLIEELSSTTLVHPGQSVRVDRYGFLHIRPAG